MGKSSKWSDGASRVSALLICVMLLVGGCSPDKPDESPPATPIPSLDTGAGADEKYTQAFIDACSEINLDIALIKNWEQIDDWANGERFRFTYERQSIVVYVNADGTVNGINLGQTQVYEHGFEPYNVADYIVDESIASALIPYAEDTVKLALNYPSTADFPFFDWAYGREGDVYILQSSVEAKNGFGVESEMPFTVMFDMGTEGKANCVYLQLDGAVIEDKREPFPERKKVEIPENVESRVGFVVGTGVNLRSEASTEGNVLAKVSEPQEIEIKGEDGEWYKVNVNGHEGFLHKDYVTLKNGEDTVPINDAIAVSAAQIVREMGQDYEATRNKYVNKYLTVSGKIVEISAYSDIIGYYLVNTLQSGKARVVCWFATGDRDYSIGDEIEETGWSDMSSWADGLELDCYDN